MGIGIWCICAIDCLVDETDSQHTLQTLHEHRIRHVCQVFNNMCSYVHGREGWHQEMLSACNSTCCGVDEKWVWEVSLYFPDETIPRSNFVDGTLHNRWCLRLKVLPMTDELPCCNNASSACHSISLVCGITAATCLSHIVFFVWGVILDVSRYTIVSTVFKYET